MATNHADQPVTLDDPVVYDLRQAEAHYLEQQNEWQRQIDELRGELRAMEYRVIAAQKESAESAAALDVARRQIDGEREQVKQERKRAEELKRLLRDIHRALFSGNVYDLILRACLTISGATRGLYVTLDTSRGVLRVRSAVDVDGYPQAAPSTFIKAICERVLESDTSFVANDQADLDDYPRPGRDGERFANLIAAPVVLLKHLNGVIIVGDRMSGRFDQQDVDSLVEIGNQSAVAVENNRLRRELQSAYLATVGVLADAIEAKDPYTLGHCELVSSLCRLIADRLDLSPHDRDVVCYAALLHDTGKIGVSDGILNKPGPLLDEERELVRTHVRVGHDLIRHVPALECVADAVLHHHEWFDGSGYPDGLSGETIPLAARIVAAVDAYAAMISQRSYKPAYSDEQARAELRRCAGTQFDPEVVEILLDILAQPETERLLSDDEANCGMLPGFDHLHILDHSGV
jgi:HD-GYP domain-containing protein (c-di-GMP phosphodiesterase class II)